jgi:filamentous hemagglutinin family protein
MATFQPEASITRIFGRVTGGQISQIDGELRVNGNADLFLINPTGIQFGSNAKLTLNGSFIGTTAQAIDFGNSEKFGVGSNLLSIKTPIGLDILRSSGGIIVQGNTVPLNTLGDPRFTPTIEAGKPEGLAVTPGKTLALIGNGISLNQAAIVAPSGNLELHSVAAGSVQMTENSRGYHFQALNSEPSDLNIQNLSRLDSSGRLGSQIRLSGQNISVSGGASLLIQNLGEAPFPTSLIEVVGNSLTLQGFVGLQSSRITSEHFGLAGADIRLNVDNLAILDGGNISTRSYGIGDSGRIDISSKAITLDNSSFNANTITPFYSAIVASGLSPSGQSSGGDISIQTQTLNVQNGSGIYSRNLGINAQAITVQGSLPATGQPSGIFSNTGNNGTTGRVNITTSTLAVLDGANIGSNTSSLDPAGNIDIQASQSIAVSGRNPNLKFAANNDDQSGIVSVAGNRLVNDLFFTNQQRDYGSSGTIQLTTPFLSVNGARIITTNLGRGNAGTILVTADQAILKQSSILSDAQAGDGGGIKANIRAIQIFDSLIGAASNGNGIGGNILIDAETITAFRSLMSASSTGNRGGRIQANATGVFNDRATQAIVTSGLGPEFNGQLIINAINNESLRNQLQVNQITEVPAVLPQCADSQGSGSSFVKVIQGGNSSQHIALSSIGWFPDPINALPTVPASPLEYQDAQGWESIPTPSNQTGRWVRLIHQSKQVAHTLPQNAHHENCK